MSDKQRGATFQCELLFQQGGDWNWGFSKLMTFYLRLLFELLKLVKGLDAMRMGR
jgi:hypothetical protein